ncbi:unnamed protein product [Rotaria sordida]|uniref:Chitobiosyldiphosphodolichol beta-mannosyltransferase n=1 Tax=Rotaria sordida TaxID=392033 RepID=A0A818M913_9BILA|nr:unnamed protein product [Rotaria sordida]CAF0881691.1 unnamed protein product [Rotaria sordida]CAF3554293.1 unnamed protein product [Rotaria sordida]CAF3587305.1 unnamed protein product [Rotaria sordida]
MLTFLCALLVVGIIILVSKLRRPNISTQRCVHIVVLGDLGRSPRMCNHAIEFEKHKFNVKLIGYAESKLGQKISNNQNIEISDLKSFPKLDDLPAVLVYGLKILWQFGTLIIRLCQLPKPDFICVQNPPSIPAILATLLIAKLRGARLIIDWHNYGYSMLALKHGFQHWIVHLCQRYEFFLGQLADINICVSNTFAKDLGVHMIKASVLYDKPTNLFHIPTIEEKHQIFMKMNTQYSYQSFQGRSNNSTRFTKEDETNNIVCLQDRPAILVSSTSWSEDENFALLFDALKKYGSSEMNNLPSIVCIVTGKGPLKDQFIEQVERERDQYRHIEFCFPWLDADDYPLLLGCADIGVSLHQSSSGFDLPMKVVDMFAVGVPACSVQYDCIDELVKRDQNGIIFQDANDLCDRLQSLLHGFPNRCLKLNNLKSNLSTTRSKENWSKEWETVMKPLLHLESN